MEKRILTGGEAAEYLGIGYETLRSKLQSGEIPLKPINSIRRGCFDKKAIDAWLDKQSGLDNNVNNEDHEIMESINNA